MGALTLPCPTDTVSLMGQSLGATQGGWARLIGYKLRWFITLMLE